MMRLITSLAAAVGLFAACAPQGSAPASQIAVEGATFRVQQVDASVASAHFVITNTGGADRLIGVEAQGAERAELHDHVFQGDNVRMVRIEAVEVAAGGEVAFKPGGKHVMIFGLSEAAAAAKTINLTLTFEGAGAIMVAAQREDAGEAHGGHKH